MAHSICGYTCGWQVKLCDPSLTCAIPERLIEVIIVSIERHTNVLFAYILCHVQDALHTSVVCGPNVRIHASLVNIPIIIEQE